MISMNGRPELGATSATAYKSGPRQGSTGIPSISEMRNPTQVVSKISIDTNVTTSLPLMIRPWLDGYEKQYHQGSILFVYCDNKRNRLETVADLPTLNFLLEEAHNSQKKQRYATGMFNELKSELTDAQGNKVKNTIENRMNLFGVLRNDMMADSNLQKLLNVDVFGRSMVANIFGRLKRGDHLGLVLKRIKPAEQYQGFVQPDNAILPSVVVDTPADGILQVLPAINGKIADVVGQAAKEYELYMPLGIVSHAVARVPSLGHRKNALRSQSHYTLLPRIEILMI